MSEKNFGHLGASFQQGLLKTIIEDRKFAITIIDVIKSSYFDGPYFKYIMENIKELYNEFRIIPSYDALEQKMLSENLGSSAKVHLDTLNEIKSAKIENNPVIRSLSLKFCKQQVLKSALKESEGIMQNGEFEEYDKIENLIKNALQVGTKTDDISEIGQNIRESLLKDARVPFPTGITGLDNLLKGGLARGELGIVLAPTGIGKTTLLTKFANSAYNHGANVLHLFFEDNMNEVRKKHYTIWTGIPSDRQNEEEDEVVDKITEITSDRVNYLYLSKMSSFGVSISDIRNKIRKMETEGKTIDILVLDYIDCITTERSIEGEEWKGEGTITRALEGMSDEFNIAIWTATQGNRQSIGSDVVTTDQMGGSIKKAQVGHVILSVAKSLEQKENNIANLTLLKSRIGKDGVVFQNCQFNNELLLFDTESQNTLLGHQEEVVEAKKQHAADVYKDSLERKKKIKDNFDKNSRLKLESAVSKVLDIKEEKNKSLNLLQNFEDPVDDKLESVMQDESIIIKSYNSSNNEMNARKRAAEVYKNKKKK